MEWLIPCPLPYIPIEIHRIKFANSALPHKSLLLVFLLFPDPLTQLLVGDVFFVNVKCPCISLYFIILLDFSFHGSSNNDIVETDYNSPFSCCLFSCFCVGAVCQESARCTRWHVVWDPTAYEILCCTRSRAIWDSALYKKPDSIRNCTDTACYYKLRQNEMK
jgi:hypothetical protein